MPLGTKEDTDIHTKSMALERNDNLDADIERTELKLSWRALFHFTSKKDIFIAAPGIFFIVIAGALKPTMAIFLGRIFNEMAAYGGGATTSEQLMKDVSTWCIALTGLAFATWLFNSSFFALSLLFGERQAMNARERLFVGMLRKEMEWYDLRTDGIASLLIRIQTWVIHQSGQKVWLT